MYLDFLWYFLVKSDTLKNPTLRNLTLAKHFMNLIFYKDDKLYIKILQKIFFYAFNTIIKLFITIVYIRIITLTLIFHDHPLVEYPLSFENSNNDYQLHFKRDKIILLAIDVY